MKTLVSRTVVSALSSASIVAIAAAGVAEADRTPAPIVYAQSGPSAQTASTPKVKTASPVQLTQSSRVQFRYPGAETSGPAMPVTTPTDPELAGAPVFTAPKSVSTYAASPVAESDKSAPVTAMTFAVPQVSTPPVVAAAAAPRQPIRIAALQTQPVARTGKPLTLSRVAANRDAAISEERGAASIYVEGFNGQPTANGEIFDATAMTAAHPSLPLPSLVQVTNEANGREVVVRVNDRGPFDGKRILEVSPRAGDVLGMSQTASSQVRIRYLGPAPVKPSAESFAARKVDSEPLPPVQPQQQTAVLNATEGPVTVRRATPPTYAAPISVARLSVAAPAAMGNVFIQAGAFADISNAQRLTTSLRAGLPVKIEEARVNGGDYFRVLIGPFPNMDAAAIERDMLSRTGTVDGFLTTR